MKKMFAALTLLFLCSIAHAQVVTIPIPDKRFFYYPDGLTWHVSSSTGTVYVDQTWAAYWAPYAYSPGPFYSARGQTLRFTRVTVYPGPILSGYLPTGGINVYYSVHQSQYLFSPTTEVWDYYYPLTGEGYWTRVTGANPTPPGPPPPKDGGGNGGGGNHDDP